MKTPKEDRRWEWAFWAMMIIVAYSWLLFIH